MKLLRIDQVVELTGLKPSSIYKQIREGNFPRSIFITKRAKAWPESVVQKWIEEVVANAEEASHELK